MSGQSEKVERQLQREGTRCEARKPSEAVVAEDSSSAGYDGRSASSLPPVLTVEEFAEWARINPKSAYAAIRLGQIPGVRRIGRTIRLSRDTVLEWLAEGQGASRSRRKP